MKLIIRIVDCAGTESCLGENDTLTTERNAIVYATVRAAADAADAYRRAHPHLYVDVQDDDDPERGPISEDVEDDRAA